MVIKMKGPNSSNKKRDFICEHLGHLEQLLDLDLCNLEQLVYLSTRPGPGPGPGPRP